jgi:formylglycine-generating enzyme required for sulfatase activity/energy-coupling factor transporter ATP-binding protein EcfA2
MSATPPKPSNNPLAEALRGLFGPLLDLLKGLPPLLAFGGVTMLLVVVIALLGAVVPDNLVPLLYLAFVLTEAAFVWSLWDERRRAGPPEPQTQVQEPDDQPTPSPPAPPTDPTDLRARYLYHLIQVCNQLHLTAIDRKAATRPEAAELDLSEVFTTLDVMEIGTEIETEIEIERRRRGEGRRSAIGALAEHPRLVLLGEPGSGKTTLVRFVSACLAGDELGLDDLNARRLGDEWDLPRPFPVRVVLRDYAARGLAQGVGLWDFVAAELGRVESGDGNLAPFAPQLKRALQRRGGLLLLDGLDEVPDANQQRERLKATVERFARDFDRCRILVTSRPYAYQNPAWHLAGFEVRRLADFSPEQVQDFIAKWYAQIAVKDAAFGAENAARYTAQLQNAVQTNPRLAELAPRPLLLTLMASLHRWRHGGALPDKREELYDESVKLLLDLWQRPKQRFDAQGRPAGEEYSVWDELRISPDNLREALNRVAFEAHLHQPTTTGTHDIPLRTLAGVLYEASDERAAISIERVCSYVSDRTGLLVERGEGVYAFPHRTFQEYLAACHLTDDDFPDKLADLCRQDDERWREAVLLAAAKAARGARSSVWLLAETLCPKDLSKIPTPDSADWYAALRAAQALVETEQHHKVAARDEDKLERLRAWLTALVTRGLLPPPDRAAAGRALAAIGDPRPGVTVLRRKDEGRPLPDIIWCPVPGGTLQMGSVKGDRWAYEREHGPDGQPVPVEIAPFFVSAYPITNAQFQTFVDDPDGYSNSAWWTRAGIEWRGDRNGPEKYGGAFDLPNHPVVGVTWYEAVAYCKWASEQMDKWRILANGQTKGIEALGDEEFASLVDAVRHSSIVIRLPTEAEWEWAARGPEALRWPWGNEWEEGRCNSQEAGVGHTSAVGAFPGGTARWLAARGAPVHDLAGNMIEWCATRWQKNYPLAQVDEWSEDYLGGTSPRVWRGSSFSHLQVVARGAFRFGDDPLIWDGVLGFRVVAGASS